MADPDLRKLDEMVAQDPGCSRPVRLQNVLQSFIIANEDAGRSPNFSSQVPDNVDSIVTLVSSAAIFENDDLAVRALKVLKILSRKYDNRIKLGPLVAGPVVRLLGHQGAPSICGEAANVVLNICYERENVQKVVDAGGVPPLIALLDSESQELQANAAGAVQSICFQAEGRSHVRELGAIPKVLPLLSSSSLKVQTRAVGAIHNISSEPEAIRIIRRLEGIAPLITLLRVPSAAVCGSAAGALQNLSRESTARQEIREMGAVVPLADLLFGDDVQSQARAAPATRLCMAHACALRPHTLHSTTTPNQPLLAAQPNPVGRCAQRVPSLTCSGLSSDPRTIQILSARASRSCSRSPSPSA